MECTALIIKSVHVRACASLGVYGQQDLLRCSCLWLPGAGVIAAAPVWHQPLCQLLSMWGGPLLPTSLLSAVRDFGVCLPQRMLAVRATAPAVYVAHVHPAVCWTASHVCKAFVCDMHPVWSTKHGAGAGARGPCHCCAGVKSCVCAQSRGAPALPVWVAVIVGACLV